MNNICDICGKEFERTSSSQKRHLGKCQNNFRRAYQQTPKFKACNQACAKAYRQTPKAKAYAISPDRKAYLQAYCQKPERKLYNRAYNKRPERKAIDKVRKQTSEYKAYMQSYVRTSKYKIARRVRYQVLSIPSPSTVNFLQILNLKTQLTTP